MISAEHNLFSTATMMEAAKIIILALCILIVAIPEGLPLAVSIAMALSINKLKNDQILIKNVSSVQTCAMLHDICIGKTGTITQAKMDVSNYQFCDQIAVINRDTPDHFKNHVQMEHDLKRLIVDSIVNNTDVRFEPTNKVPYVMEPFGQELEVGLVKFLLENEEDVQQLFVERNRYQEKVVQLPFCQTLKRKVVVRKV